MDNIELMKRTLMPILNIADIEINEVQVEENKIIITLTSTKGSSICIYCNNQCMKVHQKNLTKTIRDKSISDKLCYLKIKQREFYCDKCKKYFMERLSFANQHERYTNRYAEFVAKIGKELNVSSVSAIEGLGYDAVKKLIADRSHSLLQRKLEDFPTSFGIDEFAYRKGKRDYGVVIGNARTKEPCCLLPSRKENVLRVFFSTVKQEIREKIITISMDMWATFINLAEEFFPNAAIVIDRFHVMKQMNKVVDKVRKAEQKKLSKEDRKLLKGLRWVLLRNNEDLKEEEKTLLKLAFSSSEKIHKVYLRKEEFRTIFERNTDRKKAKHQLAAWMQQATKIKQRSMTTFLKTLKKRKEYILNYFNHYESNGFMEGIINKIKTIKRKAFGMPNFMNLYRRIMWEFEPYP